MSSLLESRYPKIYSIVAFGWDKKVWYKLYKDVSLVALAFIYLYFSANIYGRISYEAIKAEEPIELRFSDNEIKKRIMIGKTSDIIFFLSDDKVIAIPITSLVKEFEI